jgi:hypothetical protein
MFPPGTARQYPQHTQKEHRKERYNVNAEKKY